MVYRNWDGREWQDYCLMLLHKRYKDHSLQEVPDRHRGDLGIEAFSLDGCAFQCYAALEPLSTQDLYESQRDKLTADLNKLEKNKAKLPRILGDLKIQRYVFMVHRLDSRLLLEHAINKVADVRAWGLDFIHTEFKVVVVTDDHYPAERAEIVAIPLPLVVSEPVTEENASTWIGDNSPLLQDAARKLEKLGLSGDGLSDALDSLTYQFLDGENALLKLRERYPDHWAAAQRCRSRRERRLPLQFPAVSNTSVQVVTEVVDALRDEIASDAPSISGAIAETIAWATVADWIMRCPLDFEPS
ncbi:MAG: hypothetical protein ACRCYU_06940 [Nocardioides sp.]